MESLENIKLPDDIGECHALIRSLLEKIKQLKGIEEIVLKQQQQIEQLQKIIFGKRSEKKSKPAKTNGDAAPPSTEKGNGHGRKKLPGDLPRKRVNHELTGKDLLCADCNREKKRIGEEVSEQLEYVPASLLVIEHVCGKYACPCCNNGVTTAAKPMQPIEKGLAGPGLLAHVATSKYADHLPLNRQEGILARHGVDIARSTMCDWMAQAATLVMPLYDLMKKRTLLSEVIHTDDTPVRVLDRSLTKTRTGRFWDYIGDVANPYDVFDYTPNRKRDGPVAFLGVTDKAVPAANEYVGFLHADAYGGYDGIYAGKKIIEVACWAHARRKFFDAQTSEPIACEDVLSRIRQLYAIEKDAALFSPQDRLGMRQERSKPILDQLHAWLLERHTSVLPRGPLGGAISYALSNWEALTRYVDHGILAIDNNAAERGLRSIAVGRKNWMFAGSDTGGKTAAILITLISSAKRHGHDPFAYLRDVFTRISAHPANRLEEFLPDRWKPVEDDASNSKEALGPSP